MALVSRDHHVCMFHLWVLVRDPIILYLAILIKVHRLVISKVHGMVRVLMDLQDFQEALLDLVVRHSKGHPDLAPVNIDLPACNFTEVRLDRPAKDHHADRLDILVDLQAILEERNHVLNGTDRQECIMGLRDHLVSLNINICKGRSLAKAHHREGLLQVLWVVQEDRPQGMVVHHKDLLRDLLVVQHLM